MENDKIKASHILVMHKESKDSRSDISKDKAKKSIYSLPEITGNKIKDYNIISCPGCYPTSILLPLIPLMKNNTCNSTSIVMNNGYVSIWQQQYYE